MSTTTLFFFGVVLLIGGAEVLIRGASRLAALAGLSSLVIGLTVVALGTSSPEFAVTAIAAYKGKPDVALGNVVGSNITNLLLILGVCASILPLSVSRQIRRIDGPIMGGVTALTWYLATDGWLSRLDGLLLLTLLIVYVCFTIQRGKVSAKALVTEAEEAIRQERSKFRQSASISIGMVICGLVALIVGSQWVLGGAIAVAQYFGLTELLIGLTIVAVGTSLPEICTSLLATYKGERDIALGNVVGSNIGNLLGVLAVGCIFGGGLAVNPVALSFDIPVMVAITLFCLPVFVSDGEISRREGWILLSLWAMYVIVAYLNATEAWINGFAKGVGVLFFLVVTIMACLSAYRTINGQKSTN